MKILLIQLLCSVLLSVEFEVVKEKSIMVGDERKICIGITDTDSQIRHTDFVCTNYNNSGSVENRMRIVNSGNKRHKELYLIYTKGKGARIVSEDFGIDIEFIRDGILVNDINYDFDGGRVRFTLLNTNETTTAVSDMIRLSFGLG